MRRALRWTAAGVALPAVFLLLLAAGLTSPCAAAVCGLLALAPFAAGRGPASPQALASGGAGACVGALLLLPAAGAGGTLAAAAALACCGQSSRLGEPEPSAERGCPGEAAAALFAGVALWRCASFWLGHSLYAAALAAAGAGAGLAAGRAARARLAASTREALPGAGPMAAAAVGLLALHWLRVTGLNDAEPQRLRAPLLDWADAWLTAAQLFLVFASWTAALGVLEEGFAPDERRARAARVAPLAALLAAAALPPLQPAGAAALGFFALSLIGAWRGFARWRPAPVLSRIVPASLLVLAVLAWSASGLLRDVAVSRLEAVYPGGRLLRWTESAGRALGVYRFSTGDTLLVSEGVGDPAGETASRLETYIPLLFHEAKTALLVGAFRPEHLTAAANLGVQASLYDSASCAATLEALGGPARSTAAAACGAWRAPRGPFDAVVVHVSVPLAAPEQELRLTREAARAWRSRLTEHGVLAFSLPAALSSPQAQRAQASLQEVFPAVATLEAFGRTLLLASDRTPQETYLVVPRLTPAAGEDFHYLSEALLSSLPWKPAGAASFPPSSSARPLSALPARIRL